jgi:PTS system N-acetylglucosamine-specific IIC component
LSALGGEANVERASVHGGRLRVALREAGGVEDAKLVALGVAAVARPCPGVLHLLAADGDAERLTV